MKFINLNGQRINLDRIVYYCLTDNSFVDLISDTSTRRISCNSVDEAKQVIAALDCLVECRQLKPNNKPWS